MGGEVTAKVSAAGGIEQMRGRSFGLEGGTDFQGTQK